MNYWCELSTLYSRFLQGKTDEPDRIGRGLRARCENQPRGRSAQFISLVTQTNTRNLTELGICESAGLSSWTA